MKEAHTKSVQDEFKQSTPFNITEQKTTVKHKLPDLRILIVFSD